MGKMTSATTDSINPTAVDLNIDESILKSDLVSTQAKKSLRITCYGSSSSSTPIPYIQEARNLGYILARRGHVCVNGAGSHGCMAAMNDGAVAGNGHIVGVVHEMWLNFDHATSTEDSAAKTNGDTSKLPNPDVIREGGAHLVFKGPSENKQSSGPTRELIVARGKDLQERKRLLVENADALVVLPGGTGTWDELWEMACARSLNMTTSPIVCVNVNGFYDPFIEMLERAYEDELMRKKPEEIVHFEPTAADAVKYIEHYVLGEGETPLIRRTSAFKNENLRRSSFLSGPMMLSQTSWLGNSDNDDNTGSDVKRNTRRTRMEEKSSLPSLLWLQAAAVFVSGVGVGLLLSGASRRRNV